MLFILCENINRKFPTFLIYSYMYLADETVLSWLMELLAEDRVDPALLAVGEGGGGSPT